MALNNFTDEEAIGHCINLRDRLPFDEELELIPRWADKDALAQVINLAVKQIEERKNKTQRS